MKDWWNELKIESQGQAFKRSEVSIRHQEDLSTCVAKCLTHSVVAKTQLLIGKTIVFDTVNM